MFAQYSPLFTSGLLSDSSPASSRAASPQPPLSSRTKKAPRESLPLTVNSAIFSVYEPHTQADSTEDALYLTLMPSRRRIEQGHSFLSLDLADAHRSMSLRRKDTMTTARGRSVPTSPTSPVPAVPRLSSQIVQRRSREALTLPSPKPAPSTTLPEVPAPRRRHRPSNLTLTFSACFPELGPSSPTGRHRATNSEPMILSPPLRSSPILSPSEIRSFFPASSALTTTSTTPSTPPLTGTSDASAVSSSRSLPLAPVSAPAHATATSLKPSFSVRSTASVATRQRNRSAALAALEGRNGRKRLTVKRPKNFMSMSDDEDEDENEKQLLSVLDEEEDVVVPPLNSTDHDKLSAKENPSNGSRSKHTSVSSDTKRSRRSTLDSFLTPLANFIDFRDDDNNTSRSWRSFVELA